MKFYTFDKGEFAGAKDVIVSATGYTGSGGFEIYLENKYAEQVWEKIMEAGASCDIKPIGLGARDTLRLEMGFCLYGNDIDDNTSPLEAGLGWITKFTKDFYKLRSAKKAKKKRELHEDSLVSKWKKEVSQERTTKYLILKMKSLAM